MRASDSPRLTLWRPAASAFCAQATVPSARAAAQMAGHCCAAVTVGALGISLVAVRSARHDFWPGALALRRLLPAAGILALISLASARLATACRLARGSR